MRQDVDRRIGEKIDVVGAAGQRVLNVAGIEHVQKIQQALPVKLLNHFFSAGV